MPVKRECLVDLFRQTINSKTTEVGCRYPSGKDTKRQEGKTGSRPIRGRHRKPKEQEIKK